MTPATDANKKLLVPSIVVLLILVAVFVGYAYFGKSTDVATTVQPPIGTTKGQTPVTVPVTTMQPSMMAPGKMATITSKYKDGTYSATGTYRTPENEEQITVSITLANDTVTAANATIDATNPDSKRYQAMFLAGYKQLVVGKSIDGLNLSQVSGSSLTSAGFNDALTQIKARAIN